MRSLVAIFVALFALTALPLQAQELPPPPPPPDIEEAPTGDDAAADESTPETTETGAERGEPAQSDEVDGVEAGDADGADTTSPSGPVQLAIVSPVAGGEIGPATVIEGTAEPKSAIEIWIDDELEQRMKADANGRFKATISGLEPGTRVRIEARQIDESDEIVASTSVVGRVTAATATESVAPPPPVQDPPKPKVVEEDPVIANPQPVQPQHEAPVSQVGRGAISATAGIFGGFVGATAGFFGGLLVGVMLSSDSLAFLAYAVFGAAAGYLVAMPATIYLTGYLLDGDGNLLLTILASVGGVFLGALAVGALSEVVDTTSDLYGLGASLGISVLGASAGALAFELTSNPSRKAAEQGGLSVTPTVAPSADGRGVVLGLGGRW